MQGGERIEPSAAKERAGAAEPGTEPAEPQRPPARPEAGRETGPREPRAEGRVTVEPGADYGPEPGYDNEPERL